MNINNKLNYQKVLNIYNDEIYSEVFYEYESDNLVIDSTIDYFISKTYITKYIYTDTLKPNFMINECGLFEYPSISNYLLKERKVNCYSNSISDTCSNTIEYLYEIKDSSIIETQVFYNKILNEIYASDTIIFVFKNAE